MLAPIIQIVLIKRVMRIESKLVHLSENKAIVQVNGWLNEKNVGSTLAEGTTVEEAEDNAISRLKKRTNIINYKEEQKESDNEKKVINQSNVELPKSKKLETLSLNQEPSDWSRELTAIDLEIKRLNWNRDDEIKFIKKNLGYNNRNKITKYNEIVNYLNILKEIENSSKSNSNGSNIETMIEESDVILRELSWDNKQGREFLEKEFNVSTRKELSHAELTSFVSKLKVIRGQNSTN